ncbi:MULTISPECIES: sensor histidine kinase [unclassified Microbacterium]|uniref:sensor histidine kinase n=1 Tax=unclassified Microbacterium TaxID=2609290 RepID=UPI000CFB7F32|nr:MULTISPECIES: sensor histidine kinase [unclassified Microbacterium]PQZ54545.1 sensor histidine kinase [Microbacterium sp. MYb43]PQZ74292.1 sensor histidine kinase [Microbacterium sp. MYb40]PRB17109.1 sensor histidine kinase [Microbacterium sp. MYb54]PRB25259.1 sensor histidine kinase [Microbacterium sp. MYb50]PRB63764.1 sensor histidine kinase [Microbacterium sp. MYb24]
MTDVVLAAILGVLGGIVLSVLLLLARRLARGAADLGSDAEQAALTALHQASLAAPHLRAGLSAPDVVKAARHLRVLLGSAAVAIVSVEGAVSFDGPSDGLESAARRIATQVSTSGRRQVFPAPGRDDDLEAVGAPILVDGRVVGVVVAFAAPVRAALVRAAEEVADWCAAQVELGGLDASRTQLAEAELRSLRAQISPHFIYNALTAIASFVLTDPTRARELVLEFADFTRYSFRRQGEFTTIAEELGSIHSYLELERARFGDRLRVTLQIAPETLATVIPFLSVQPLVENAVRHGLEPGVGGGEIRIASRDDGTHTEITVEDDGVGMDPEGLRATLTAGDDGVHVGLRNVDTRLRQLYGADGGLVVETNTGAGTLVRMRVPKSQPQHDPDND